MSAGAKHAASGSGRPSENAPASAVFIMPSPSPEPATILTRRVELPHPCDLL
jgi:hypothetical protein